MMHANVMTKGHSNYDHMYKEILGAQIIVACMSEGVTNLSKSYPFVPVGKDASLRQHKMSNQRKINDSLRISRED